MWDRCPTWSGWLGPARSTTPGDGRSGPLPILAATLLTRTTFPPPGTPLVVAVSGGADSLALMVLAVAAGCEVTAVHVDHGARPGSAGEAAVVEAAAGRLGAAFRAEQAVVPPGPNFEARARAARFGVLPEGVATGHTADDQAETVLLNLLRGAGLDGLAAMRPGPAHPILGLRRSETHALVASLGIKPVTDPTNTDPRHLRNRVRAELLPALDELAGRDSVVVLARQAALLRDDADLLDELAAAVDVTDAREVRHLPPALARRAVRRWLRGEHPPSSAEVERVLAVAAGDALACELSGGRRVERSGGRLRVRPGRGDA